jgi:hypothetical protein
MQSRSRPSDVSGFISGEITRTERMRSMRFAGEAEGTILWRRKYNPENVPMMAFS